MNSNNFLEDQAQKMLLVVYQMPVGMVEADLQGNIVQINAKGVQLLMPFFNSYKLSGNNINEFLQIAAPDILDTVLLYPEAAGNIVEQLRKEVSFDNNQGNQITIHYKFTINKLNKSSLVYFFEDITKPFNKQIQLNELLLEKAIEQTKFEMASDVLHDIGNAVVGFGSYITKIKRSAESNDISTIENLKGFIAKNLPSLNNAIGEKKANALLDLLSGLITSQKTKIAEINNSVTDQLKIISHIHEILNIQRHHVKGQSGERLPVNIRNVIDDALSMVFAVMDKKEIIHHFDAPVVLPEIKGDRTKLMQVFLNLLKNAIESITVVGDTNHEKQIFSSITLDHSIITVQIKDTGSGFDAETAAKLFTRKYTTKREGTGLGLANCRSIIEGHNAEINLTSEGIGKGATATVVFHI